MSLYNFQAHSYIRRSDHTKVLAMHIFGLRANKHTYVRAHMKYRCIHTPQIFLGEYIIATEMATTRKR